MPSIVQVFIAQAAGPANGTPSVVQLVVNLLPFVAIAVLFYLMLVRPDRRKRDELLKSLKKNDRVVTIGGIFGTVVNVQKDAEDVTLRIDDGNNIRVRVLRTAIARIVASDATSDSGDA
jgi:preprotein translocase subunit YajC